MKKHGLAGLVELGFMDNAEEFQKLNQVAYQEKLIKGLVQGIQAYFGKA
ncbi:N-acetylmuramoyl-L-alanine amidase [Abiotrophia defectiva]|nr:N-acetylmuramoyl-L-alanine amidase [Abiotrophia defectiva]